MFAMPWAGEEEFEPKFARLVSKIDNYRKLGHRVSLVGASAGASAVLNAYSIKRGEIQTVAYICGKINHPETVSGQTYARNPAFKTSMLQLQGNLASFVDSDKRKLTSFYSPADTTVPYADTVINDVLEQKLPSIGHAWAIVYCLSFGSRKLVRALNRN
ncbi:MAG TPA: hypothetical protein VLG47_04695 [Candidatus Saccharimonadales bacterium]|nr:hypothetical protein [Candidatus Saccharimonadales bacterium]